MKEYLISGFVIYLLLGCSPHTVTLEDEIASHPDTWGRHWQLASSSNHWALLDRVAAVEDVHRRIHLVTLLANRLRRSPEQLLLDCGNINTFNQRVHFARSCAGRLEDDKNNATEALMASWQLEAAWVGDLEQIIVLTDGDWTRGIGANWDDPQEDREKRELASQARRLYELYFKNTFSSCIGTYRRLPESDRPAFVDQIKRDFFHRKGMALVDLSAFPPEFIK